MGRYFADEYICLLLIQKNVAMSWGCSLVPTLAPVVANIDEAYDAFKIGVPGSKCQTGSEAFKRVDDNIKKFKHNNEG